MAGVSPGAWPWRVRLPLPLPVGGAALTVADRRMMMPKFCTEFPCPTPVIERAPPDAEVIERAVAAGAVERDRADARSLNRGARVADDAPIVGSAALSIAGDR